MNPGQPSFLSTLHSYAWSFARLLIHGVAEPADDLLGEDSSLDGLVIYKNVILRSDSLSFKCKFDSDTLSAMLDVNDWFYSHPSSSCREVDARPRMRC